MTFESQIDDILLVKSAITFWHSHLTFSILVCSLNNGCCCQHRSYRLHKCPCLHWHQRCNACCHCREWVPDNLGPCHGPWRNQAAAPGAQVRIPFVSFSKLKATRYWVLAQRSIGVDAPLANDFTDDVIAEVLTRMKADKDYKRATEDTDITKPPAKLTVLVKWTKFWELFTTIWVISTRVPL